MNLSDLTGKNTFTIVNQTGTYLANSWDMILADSSGGAFNITLPAAPVAGDMIKIIDVGSSWDTDNVTLLRNGLNIRGLAEDLVLDVKHVVLVLEYTNATYGWAYEFNGMQNSDAASVSAQGIVELATDAETQTGTDTGRAVTPAGLESKSASDAEAIARTATNRIVTPSNLLAMQQDIASGFGRRNLIINGAMQIAQRGTSATGITSSGFYTCDRWESSINTLGTWTITKDTSVKPDGFGASMAMSCTTADASPAAGDYVRLIYKLEGQDLQHLLKGTASAREMTLSFWTFCAANKDIVVEILDEDNSRHVTKIFSTTSSWTQHTWTIPADTTGTLDNDNANSLSIYIWLAAGSNFTGGTSQSTWVSASNTNKAAGVYNMGDLAGNTFFISGVQLEVGSQATAFEHRSYGEELALCQRYLPAFDGTRGLGQCYTTDDAIVLFNFPVETRTAPTGISIGTAGNTSLSKADSTGQAVSTIAFSAASTMAGQIEVAAGAATLVAGNATVLNLSTETLLWTGCEL